MIAPVRPDATSSYPVRLAATLGQGWRRLTRTPSHSRRAEAARRLAFTIAADGVISALPGSPAADLKKVARAAFAPYETPSARRV
jgi:hypothetical protein